MACSAVEENQAELTDEQVRYVHVRNLIIFGGE